MNSAANHPIILETIWIPIEDANGRKLSALPELLPDCLYACDPRKPYQKGQVEYMNKLIRQYIPKGISLRNITQAKLNCIAAPTLQLHCAIDAGKFTPTRCISQ